MNENGTYVFIKRPDAKNVASYLYNSLLRKLKWEKVTMVLRDPDVALIEKLKSHGIQHYVFRSVATSNTDVKNDVDSKLSEKLVSLMIKANIDSSIYGVEFSDDERARVIEIYKKIRGK